jgi:HAMP domain-containing protein
MFKLKIKSIKEEKVYRKFLLAFILMSVVPLLIILYIIKYVIKVQSDETLNQVQWLIFWISCSSLVGYWLIRRMLTSFLSVAKSVRNVAEGNFSVKIENAEELEINELAQSFGRITRQLETNISELQKSKQLIQDVLSRVGEAVASFQNIDRFLELIMLSTIDALKADSGQLMLIDNDTGELVTRLFSGKSRISPDRVNLENGGMMGRVAKDGRHIIALNETTGVRVICVPLTYSGKIIGVFALGKYDQGQDFSEDDKVLLEDLASQIAVALENYRLSADAERTYVETITALAMAVEARDEYTRGHTHRVAEYCNKLARAFNLDDKTAKMLNDASNLHDIGKIGVPDGILRKSMPLTAEETKMIHEHPIIGEHILKPIHSLADLCYLVRHHHEQLDGNGYPDKLKGDELSLSLHIMIVADVFDAMTTDRPYRKGMSFEEAKKELRRYSGIRYSPEVVEKFLQMV